MARPLGRFAAVGCTLAVALAMAACGDDGPKEEAGGSGGGSGGGDRLEDVEVIDGTEADVKVLDNTFNAENIEVAPGTKVVWTNNGRQDHDIVPVDEDAGWGIEPGDFQPDAVYEYTFDQPGTYRYYCSLHGTESAGMVGAVVVED